MDDVVSSVLVEEEFRADELSDATSRSKHDCNSFRLVFFFCFGFVRRRDSNGTSSSSSRREGLLDDDDDDEVAFNEGAAAERIVMVLKRVFVMTKRYAKITQM